MPNLNNEISNKPDNNLQSSNRALLVSTSYLIIINLIFVPIIFYQQLNPFMMIFLYWMESIIIGFFNIFKMILAGMFDQDRNFYLAGLLGAIGLTLFFIIHFGGFNAGHFVFLLVFSMINSGAENELQLAWDNFLHAFSPLGIASSKQLLFSPFFAVLLLFSSHLLSFIINFLKPAKFYKQQVTELMFIPYKRVIVMHITIIASAFALVYYMDLGLVFIVILSVLKTSVDVFSHIKEHSKQEKQA